MAEDQTDFEKKYADEFERLSTLSDEPFLRALDRLIALAETEGSPDDLVSLYDAQMNAASNFGRFDYELKAFQALRHLYTRGPEFDHLRESLLWYFKWIVERLPEYADVSRETIETVFGQMTEFYKEHLESLRPVYGLRCRAAAFLGDKAKADQYAAQWEATEAGDSSDCPACETHTKVQYLLDTDRVEEAVAAAAPILSGEQYCEEVPAITFSRLLLPILTQGDGDLSEGMHRFSRSTVRRSKKLLSYLANHINYLCVTMRAPQARKYMLLLYLRGCQAANPYHQFCAWRSLWIWLRRMAYQYTAPVMIPPGIAPATVADQNRLLEWAAVARSRATDLGAAFDRRSGNNRFVPSLEALAVSLDQMESMPQSDQDQDETT